MDKILLNLTWSNESDTTLQSVNSTLENDLSTKHPQITIFDWEAERKAMKIIEIIFHCMFLVVGLFGNILTIVVLVFKKWTNITSKNILIALAVSDTTMLFTHTFNQDFLKDLFKLDARTLSNFGCKVFFAFYRASKFTSSWFVAFLCFERFVAVVFPLKVKTIITDLRTKVYILVTYLTMASIAIVLSFSSATESKTCQKDTVASDLMPVFKALMLTDSILYSVLPILLMSILTPIIILQLFKRYQTRKKLTSKTEAGKEREMKQLKEMIRTTTILISVVAVFIICVTPKTVYQQVKFWLHISKKEIETTHSLFAFREISQWFEHANYSINFFLYIFTSPKFRRTVLEMLHLIQSRESTSSGCCNKMKKIEQCKAKQAELPSTSGQSTNGEVKGKELVPDELESSQETIPFSQGETKGTEKDTQIPFITDKSNSQVREQNSEQEEHLTEKTSTQKLTGTVIKSRTVQNDEHLVPTCNKKSTDADVIENKAPPNDNLVLLYIDEKIHTNILLQNAPDDQLRQIKSTEQANMDESEAYKSSLNSVFTDEQSIIQEEETTEKTNNQPAFASTTQSPLSKHFE